MADALNVDICVIGAGSGGLSVAAGAAQMGASVALFERGRMGGDCLNYGCVPSKALLAAGRAAAQYGHTGQFGVHGAAARIDFDGVHDHVHGVIASIAPHDSVERFTGLGVKVFQESARFAGPREIEGSAGTRVRARRIVVATGSSPAVPPIPGLDAVDYLTNESLFDLTSLPEHLIIVGGGPIGLEMAQAFRRLGAAVTVVEALQVLNNDDRELAGVVRARLVAEGVDLREGAKVVRIEKRASGGVTVIAAADEAEAPIAGSHLLVAVGRRPNIDGLGLETAGVDHSPKGIAVDARLRTSNPRIFAVGDVAGGYQFTHIAGYHAGIVIRNALFRLPARVDYRAVPWVTYTDPELANVGLSETAARARHGAGVEALTASFAGNDRARTERRTEGMVKVVVDRRGRILGAGIVGDHAGELLLPWCLAISQRLKIGAMASLIAPYPTLGEAGKQAAGSFYTPKIFSARMRRIVRLIARLPG